MKTSIKNGKFLVQSDYCEEFVTAARRLSGVWKAPNWVFPEAAEPHVRAALLYSYGEDGTAEPERVQVRVEFLETAHGEKAPVSVGPIEVARAWGRDSGAKTAPNVLLLSGVARSGGSRWNWRTTVEEGAVFLLVSVPRLLADRLVNEFGSEKMAVSIVEPEPVKPAEPEISARPVGAGQRAFEAATAEAQAESSYADYLETSAKEAAAKIFGQFGEPERVNEPAAKPTAKKPKKSRSSPRAKNPKGPVSPTVMEELRRGEPEMAEESFGQAWGPEDLKKPAEAEPVAPEVEFETVKSLKSVWLEIPPDYAVGVNKAADELGVSAAEFVEKAVLRAIQLHFLDSQIMEGKRKGGFGPREAGRSEGPREDEAAARWRPLTLGEILILEHFQALHGIRWRKTLRDLWAFADPRDENERVLYALRNSHGPSWLEQYGKKQRGKKKG